MCGVLRKGFMTPTLPENLSSFKQELVFGSPALSSNASMSWGERLLAATSINPCALYPSFSRQLLQKSTSCCLTVSFFTSMHPSSPFAANSKHILSKLCNPHMWQYDIHGALPQVFPEGIFVPYPLLQIPSAWWCQATSIMKHAYLARYLALSCFSFSPMNFPTFRRGVGSLLSNLSAPLLSLHRISCSLTAGCNGVPVLSKKSKFYLQPTCKIVLLQLL